MIEDIFFLRIVNADDRFNHFDHTLSVEDQIPAGILGVIPEAGVSAQATSHGNLVQVAPQTHTTSQPSWFSRSSQAAGRQGSAEQNALAISLISIMRVDGRVLAHHGLAVQSRLYQMIGGVQAQTTTATVLPAFRSR